MNQQHKRQNAAKHEFFLIIDQSIQHVLSLQIQALAVNNFVQKRIKYKRSHLHYRYEWLLIIRIHICTTNKDDILVSKFKEIYQELFLFSL